MKLQRTQRRQIPRRPELHRDRHTEQKKRRETQQPEQELGRLLSSMLDRLAAMLQRMSATSGSSSSSGGTSAVGSGGLPNLNPSQGSPVFGGAPVFTGFDAQKLADPLKLGADGQPKSAKYTFAKLAQQSGTMPRSKAEAEQWFNRYIKPGMEEAGFQVDWVKGDKALIHTRENPQGEVVDFVRGAGSTDPNYTALAWQPEGVSGSGGASGASGVGSGWVNSDFVLSILRKYPPTNEGIEQALEELRRHPGYENAKILQHPLRLDKIDFGNGQVVDVIGGAGGPNPSWGWMPE